MGELKNIIACVQKEVWTTRHARTRGTKLWTQVFSIRLKLSWNPSILEVTALASSPTQLLLPKRHPGVPSAASSRSPANAAAALLAVLGSTNAEALVIPSLITRGPRAHMPAKERLHLPLQRSVRSVGSTNLENVVAVVAVGLGSGSVETRETILITRGLKVCRHARNDRLLRDRESARKRVRHRSTYFVHKLPHSLFLEPML